MKLLLIRILKLIFPERRKSDDSVKKILVIRQDNRIGNLLFITPLLREIKKAFPGVILDVLTAGRFPEIFDNNPNINRVIEYQHRQYIFKPWRLIGLILKLRRAEYDIVFDTKDVLSFNNAMLSVLSGGTKVVGYGYRGSRAIHNISVEVPPAEMYEPGRHLRLLNAVADINTESCSMEIFLDEKDIRYGEYFLDAHGLKSGEVIVIHCGGRGRKSYGVKRFFTVAKKLLREHSQKSLLIYGPDEENEVKKLNHLGGVIAVGPGDIRRMASLIYHSKMFLSGDTGALHIAVALGKPTVSLFFGSYRARYAPKGNDHQIYDKLDIHPDEDDVVKMVIRHLASIKREKE